MRHSTHAREHDVPFVCNNEGCSNDQSWNIRGVFNTLGTFKFEGDDYGSEADCPECGVQGSPEDTDIIFTVIE